MKYRKYESMIKAGAIALMSLGLAACASSGGRQLDSVGDEEHTKSKVQQFDGREPASMHGDFTWLNEVEDDFGRIAAETSNRAVASQDKHETLVKEKGWTFSFHPKTNHFYVVVQGVSYKMIQTRIDEGERFAFAAEGQAENPVTFSVLRGDGRGVASSGPAACGIEIAYWNKKSKSYATENKSFSGKACERLLSLLKDYVP